MSRRRAAKSAQWRRVHERDAQVRAARAQGYRSRAALKLIEIDDSAKLLFSEARVADLGSAPGGWSQVAAKRTGKNGCIVAVDILPMAKIDGVHFVQGDFMAAATAAAVRKYLGESVNIVLSDMSPNLSGIAATDQGRAAALAQAALEFALQCLSPEGRLLVKVFQGKEFDGLRELFERHFAEVRFLRLQASRQASREGYFLATRKKA